MTAHPAGPTPASGPDGSAARARRARPSWQAHPVAVIGNGPVGQTAALLLARWGIRVLLLDRRPRRELVGSKSICQQRDVLDVWDSVGAGRRIAEEGVTWRTARTFLGERELFRYTLPESATDRFPAFVNISQSRTEQILDERIAAQPLIAVFWDHRVIGLDEQAGRTAIRCRTATGEVELAAGYVLACAGASGHEVRGMLGVDFAGHSFADRFLICDIRTDLPGRRAERRFHFDPPWLRGLAGEGRQVLIHPCPDKGFRIDWQVPPDYELAAEEADGTLDRRIRAIIGDRRNTVTWKSVYRFSSRLADRFRIGRVLLAGDCAHLVAPFGARGLNAGVADAENAAWKIAAVLRGWADESILDSYQQERRAAAEENLAVTTATMDFLVPHTDAQRAYRREVLRRAGTDPVARAEVDSGRLAEPFWYTDSPLTTPSADRPGTGRPPRGGVPPPAPGVLLPDVLAADPRGGPAAPLRRLARTGFLVLSAPGTDAGEMRSAAAAVRAPVTVRELDRATADALTVRPGEVWVLRPDAHLAAILPGATPDAVRRAVWRACGIGR